MSRTIAAILAALMAFDIASGPARALAPGETVPVRFFCTEADPVLDMLRLDAEGEVEAARDRFEAARAEGICHVLPEPVPGTAQVPLAAAEIEGSGRVEVWRVRIVGVGAEVFAGFRVAAPAGDPA